MSRIFDYADKALRYGKILTNDEYETTDGIFVRIHTIYYDGKIYYHTMNNGELDSFIPLTDKIYE